LDYAAKNGVTEIYLNDAEFNAYTADFIARAHEKGIKVYRLDREDEAILDDTAFRDRYLNKYLPYQASRPPNQRFAGVHLDMEPWGLPDYSANSGVYRQNMIDFMVGLRDSFPSEHFDYDLDVGRTQTVTYRGQPNVPLYQAMIQEADRVIIMSYRDTAEKIYNLTAVPAYIAYAKSLDKPIFLSVNATNPSGSEDNAFDDRGKSAMYYELNKLKAMANYNKLGLAIHQMSRWYDLPDYGVECEKSPS